MAVRVVLAVFSLASTIIACPDYSSYEDGPALRKRAEGVDWAYEASYNWGMLNESKWLIY